MASEHEEINARTIIPWRTACEWLGVNDGLLKRICAKHNIPVIAFSQRSRGLLLHDLDNLIAIHARLLKDVSQ